MRLSATRTSAIRHSSARSLEQQIAAIYRDTEGVWYDPSDMKTMFQDAAGTIPITAVEQPVGLILDKSGNGNHASQTVSTRRPVLSARKNWLLGTDVLATQNVTVRATPQVLSFYGTGTVTLSGTATGSPVGTGANDRVSLTFTPTAGTLTLTVSGSVTKAQLDEGAAITLYQRVGAVATDYDTAGHPIFLKFDSVDDSLSTPTIDFTSTDKMTVVAGVRKLSDAATGIVVEFSTTSTNNGSFYVAAPVSAVAKTFGIAARGTNPQPLGYTLVAPCSAIATLLAHIGGASLKLKINGTLAASAGSLGSGYFGNYPLFIGARAGTDLFFNGHINQLTIFGKTLTPSQLATVERYTGRKTGITL